MTLVDPQASTFADNSIDAQKITDNDRQSCFPIVQHQTSCVQVVVNVRRRKWYEAADNLTPHLGSNIAGRSSDPELLSKASCRCKKRTNQDD